jgi:hypothetical protein
MQKFFAELRWIDQEGIFMNKKTLFFFLGLSIIIVACNLVKRNTPSDIIDDDIINYKKAMNAKDNNNNVLFPSDDTKNQEIKLPTDSIDENQTNPSDLKPVTHYDSKILDKRVQERAKLEGRDPETYRMLIRTEADATKIYRMLGMHVIVNPNGEEVYLPDEI